MFAQPPWGRAWGGCPKPRRRSWLRKQSAQALQTAIKTRVVSTGRRGGPSRTTVLVVKLPSRGFGHRNAKIAGLGPAHHLGFHSPMAFHSGGLGRSKNPTIQELLPPALWSLRTGLRTAGGGATCWAPHALRSK